MTERDKFFYSIGYSRGDLKTTILTLKRLRVSDEKIENQLEEYMNEIPKILGDKVK